MHARDVRSQAVRETTECRLSRLLLSGRAGTEELGREGRVAVSKGGAKQWAEP